MPRESDVPQASMPPHTIVVYASKVRVVLVTMAALAFAGIGGFLTLQPGTESPHTTAAAGIALSVMGAAGVVTEVVIFLSPKPRLIVNDKGIWINSWINSYVLGVPFNAWDNIAFLMSFRPKYQFLTLLRIALVDTDAVSAQQSRLQRFAFLLLASEVAKFRMITTADGILETSTEQILQRIEQQFHHEFKHYHIRVIRV
jgi:hypothetical protein